MILSAMGTDFFPHISALMHAPADLNRAVNEQIQVELIPAIPGMLFTLTLAPLLLQILTSPEFTNAAVIAR